MNDDTSAADLGTISALLHIEELPCGADLDELLEQVADGRADQLSEHQRKCVHCQAAVGEFGRLWEPVRTAARSPLPTPAELKNVVMDRVQRLVKDTWFTLELTGDGSLRIAARIVARLARDAARRVPGVRAALGRSSQGTLAQVTEKATFGHRHPDTAVGVLGRSAVVDLAIAVTYGAVVDDIARQVQANVRRELRGSVGLKSITVNVTVDDVLDA